MALRYAPARWLLWATVGLIGACNTLAAGPWPSESVIASGEVTLQAPSRPDASKEEPGIGTAEAIDRSEHPEPSVSGSSALGSLSGRNAQPAGRPKPSVGSRSGTDRPRLDDSWREPTALTTALQELAAQPVAGPWSSRVMRQVNILRLKMAEDPAQAAAVIARLGLRGR